MSNYRDDTIEHAFASDTVWANVTIHTNEQAIAKDIIFHGLTAFVEESANLSDEVVFEGKSYLIVEKANAHDEVFSLKRSSVFTQERATAKDTVVSILSDLVVEEAFAIDTLIDSVMHLVHENATLIDEDLSKRTSSSIVVESAQLIDQAFAHQQDVVIENIQANDDVSGKLYAKDLIEEAAVFTDEIIVSSRIVELVIEAAQTKDHVFGKLEAISLIDEVAFAQDTILLNDESYQAWVANIETWAMSRYSPYSFDGMSVINGKLYFWNKNGVYLSGIEGEEILGKIKTGKLDFGEVLTHPNAAFLEYQLSGDNNHLSCHVTTTQSGSSQTYQYILPKETATHLTNGRIVFGRGLRGRHFSFDLSIIGTSAQINSLAFEHTPTSRRT